MTAAIGPSWGVALLMALVLAGCGGTETASKPKEDSTFKKLALLFGEFCKKHQGKPPKDEKEFRDFFAGEGKVAMESYGVTSLDAVMTSPRDNKPHVLIFGKPKGPPGGPGLGLMPVQLYEQDGVGGKRWVGSSVGAIEEVDEATFKTLVP